MGSQPTRAAVVAALVVSSVAGVSLQGEATAGASRGADAGSPDRTLVQPVVTAPAPRAHHRLPFGEATITPTTIVAAAPDQDVRIRIDFESIPLADRLLVRLYRPALPDSEEFGRNLGAVSLGTRTLDLADVRIGSARLFKFSDLNPPPGPYRIDVLLDEGQGDRHLVQRDELVVYAQHRLPPGEGSTEGAKISDVRALPTDGVNHNINFQAGNEAETFVAVQPNDATRVIAAVNPGPTNPQAWISDESMRPGTAVEQTLPSASLIPADEGGGTANLSLCCDPALAADPLGNLWYSVLTRSPNSHIVVNRVAAGTTTFQANNVAIPRATTGFQDKNMMTIDNWVASPKYGMLYVVWTENPGQNVVISQCNTRPGGVPNAANCDTPANWSEPADITDGNSLYTYSSVAAAPNGDVYVTWWDASSDNDVEIDRCLAAGDCSNPASWGPDTDIDNLSMQGGTPIPFFCPIISAPGGRVGAITYVDVGPDGRVYVAYSDLRANGSTKCSESATDSTFESFVARGATVNTFPAPNTGVRLSDDGATDLNDHFFPTLAVDPTSGDVESSLYSTKLDSTRQATHQFYVVSTDDGVSYGAMTQLTTESTDYSFPNDDGFEYGDYEGADSAQGVFFAVWSDGRLSHGGDMDLYIQSAPVETSIDSGPSGTTTDPTPTFTFSSTSSPATFACRVDAAPFDACSSPFTTATLADGPHTFEVRASYTQGSRVYTDPTPASSSFTVDAGPTPTHTLTVTTAGTGSGSVTSSPAGIDCPGDCTESYTEDQMVTLTATADSGSTFAGWSGGGCSGTGTCQVTMSADTTVTATFSALRTLTVQKAGTGQGTVTSNPAGINCGIDCGESYAHGTVVTLTATPGSGSIFAEWSGGGCSGTGTCQVTMNADTIVTATFTALRALTVALAGTGSGTVTSTPAGINCPGDCTESYPHGQMVTLTAAAGSGSTFAGWGGGGCSGTGNCQVAMNADTIVTATFSAQPPSPSPTPKQVTLTASKRKVKRGQKVLFTVIVSPCAGHAGHTVQLLKNGAVAGSASTNAACTATFKVKMRKRATFQAVSPQQDADHLAGTSNRVTVKVKKRRD